MSEEKEFDPKVLVLVSKVRLGMNEIAKLEEGYFAAAEARREAWRAHKRAEDDFIKAGSILGSKAFCDFTRTYTLYGEAGRVARKAYRAWEKVKGQVELVKENERCGY